ncbi:MAG: hypothetical protein A3G23_05970 [Bacteroidetes bacterium RIFCSPLOWO2_12_FULL_37_12]|nr:MAG: hypothetical protein A3G23_05970 [Bacteroidetes bacterium RIFCSPLOWO2_12_FULL_37_12]
MKKNLETLKHIVADFISSFLAWVGFFMLRKYILQNISEGLSPTLLVGAVVISVFWVLLYAVSGMYSDLYRKSREKELIRLFQFTLLGVLIIFFGVMLDDIIINYTSYYKTFSTYFLIHLLVVSIVKLFLLTRIKNKIANREIGFNTLLIGSGNSAKSVYEELENMKKSIGNRFVGYLATNESADEKTLPIKKFGTLLNAEEIINQHRIEEVIIAIESQEHARMGEIINTLSPLNVTIKVLPDLYDILTGSVRMSHLFGTPLIEINPNLMPHWEKVVKRFIDIVFSFLVMMLGCWFFILIAWLVRLTSRGPAFYSQIRIGKNGKPFRIFKFRTMFENSETEGPSLSTETDPRVTPFGRFLRKTRLDEFPQFWNVLKGDMSLVGPRPERKYFIDKIVEIAPQYRHLQRVKPGITSWGQIKFGYAENVNEMVERLKYDIIYIENMSLALDFKIMLFTIMRMIQARGK